MASWGYLGNHVSASRITGDRLLEDDLRASEGPSAMQRRIADGIFSLHSSPHSQDRA